MVVDQSYADTGFLRVDFEKQLQIELGAREASDAPGSPQATF